MAGNYRKISSIQTNIDDTTFAEPMKMVSAPSVGFRQLTSLKEPLQHKLLNLTNNTASGSKFLISDTYLQKEIQSLEVYCTNKSKIKRGKV